MKIVLTAGGTAGHVIPLLEIGHELKRRGHRVVYFGSGEPEKSLVKSFRFLRVFSGKWRRYLSIKNLFDSTKIVIGFFQASSLLKKFKPDAIIAKGGYVTLPVVLAARLSETALYVHESDSVMGWVNRFASRFARKVFVAFPAEFYQKISAKKLVVSGVPVRGNFARSLTQKDFRLFGLNNKLPIVLVTGGSQGAHNLNLLIFADLKDLVQLYQVIHITGQADAAKAIELRNRLPFHLQERYKVYRWLGQEMSSALVVADVVVTRGGSTLFEIAASRKQAVVVPLPNSASDHQQKNAEFFKKQFGYDILDQSTATAVKLRGAIERQLERRQKLPALPNATKIIVDEILKDLK